MRAAAVPAARQMPVLSCCRRSAREGRETDSDRGEDALDDPDEHGGEQEEAEHDAGDPKGEMAEETDGMGGWMRDLGIPG